MGTVGSRVAVHGGSAVFLAGQQVREKVLESAAAMLTSGNAFLEIEDGVVCVKGEPERKVTLAEVAQRHIGHFGAGLAPGVTPDLAATAYSEFKGLTYANGTNVCEVEVDPETGHVDIRRYVVAHDCGRLIHPGMVDGQIRGGVVHGIGNALYERMVYDEAGNPVTTNYGEYLLPMAVEMPRIEVFHLETPSPLNPIGVKGAGEGGTIPAAAAVIAAVEDALSPFGVRITEHPISPERIRQLIESSAKSL
jgi:carbon-monoxide dehydrogenase large subunit